MTRGINIGPLKNKEVIPYLLQNEASLSSIIRSSHKVLSLIASLIAWREVIVAIIIIFLFSSLSLSPLIYKLKSVSRSKIEWRK